MSRKDERTEGSTLVIQVVGSGHARRADRTLNRALRAAQTRGEICHRRVCTVRDGIDWNTLVEKADAVVTARPLPRRFADVVAARCPFFDLSWVFKTRDRSRKIFFDMPRNAHGFPGAGHGYMDDAGNIRIEGFQGAANWPWTNAGKMLRGVGRSVAFQADTPQGSPGGRVAEGTAGEESEFWRKWSLRPPEPRPGFYDHQELTAAERLARYYLELALELVGGREGLQMLVMQKILDDMEADEIRRDMEAQWNAAVAEDEEQAQQEEEDEEEEEEEEEEDDDEEDDDDEEEDEEEEEGEEAEEEQQQDQLDIQGPDFLMIMKEIYESTRIDEFWRQMVEGRVPPEKTDRREEFLRWLGGQGFDAFNRELVERVHEGMPVVGDDTPFAFQYWFYTRFGEEAQAEARAIAAKRLEYLWSKGAPIDPDAKLDHLDGIYDDRRNRLSLRCR